LARLFGLQATPDLGTGRTNLLQADQCPLAANLQRQVPIIIAPQSRLRGPL